MSRQATPRPPPKRYRLKAGVTLTAAVEQKVNDIANDFYAARRKTILVTSGTRSPASQADAMYVKIEAGADIVKEYRNKDAAKEVKKGYDQAKTAGKSKTDSVADITAVISAQVARGVYISKHLRAGAVDVRSRGMVTLDKKEFRKAAKNHASRVKLETKPPHWHLRF